MSRLREFCNNVGNEWLIHNSKNTIRRLCISILAEWIHGISNIPLITAGQSVRTT